MKDEQDILTVDEAAEFLRISRNSLYDAINRDEVPHRRIGRRIILSKEILFRWVSGGLNWGHPWKSRRKGQK